MTTAPKPRTVALTHLPSPKMEDAIRTFAAHERIDLERVRAQHAAYREALAKAGAEVVVLDTNLEHPDCVFIEDVAIVLDEIAILTPMGAPARAGEPAGIEPTLRTYREVVRIEAPAKIEGGDVVVVGKQILVGQTDRTNARGIEELARITKPHGYDVRPVPVRGCLHLKTACTALPFGALVVNPAWLDVEALRSTLVAPRGRTASGGSWGEVISVAEGEPHAANVVSVNGRVITGAGNPRTAELFRSHCIGIDVLDLSELAKADGCGTCLSLLFSSPPATS